ncbi:T9SS type A sorting domain-containing protein [Carboxylicivirga linearis]|uniref:T9SS type A sorting domain-containing protein n=1 Tax=Carboxylicivirga linearis TaxID=1628157 RepID=A0ABS5JRT3_9BACT|nr:T9SS type A sorting domain-containing protein [Carboxylicivirga linearis]MBS2097596.1 T9SS type A sorting domain-containing protein [Carboxylicivirga linearis]
MKYLLIFILSIFFTKINAQYQGPIDAITDGYGANGKNDVSVMNITNDYWALRDISIFYPLDISNPVPTIFYSHGYASVDTAFHIETLRHLASRGYAVVFVPYKSIGIDNTERYATLRNGFIKAARTATSIIDTTRVGFFGQSFGGGATPANAYKLFTHYNWGVNGRFMYCSAPWYSFEITQDELLNFSSNCNLLTVLYNDDTSNDHRMGMDIFNTISIDKDHKDCLIAYSSTIDDYNYDADHTLPAQYTNNAEFDALDYYVTFRLLDALADYTFTGNVTAKQIALSSGSTEQIEMGLLPNLLWSDNPEPIYDQTKYNSPCGSEYNPRIEYCDSSVGIDLATINESNPIVFPNPANDILNVNLDDNSDELLVEIYNSKGCLLLQEYNQKTIHITHLKSGVYFCLISSCNNQQCIKFVKSK